MFVARFRFSRAVLAFALLIAAVLPLLAPAAPVSAAPASYDGLDHPGVHHAADCLAAGDTQCAVGNMAWVLEEMPDDPAAQQAYYDTLIIDVRYDLFSGDHWGACESLDAAEALALPDTEATIAYHRSLIDQISWFHYANNMDWAWAEYEDGFTYMHVPGELGNQTRAYSLGIDGPGLQRWDHLSDAMVEGGNFSILSQFFMANPNGYATFLFGVNDYHRYVVEIGWGDSETPYVALSSCLDYGVGCEWTVINNALIESGIPLKQWHDVEIRVVGTTVSIYLNGAEILSGEIEGSAAGSFGLGVGQHGSNLSEQSDGPNGFACLFDNYAIWALN